MDPPANANSPGDSSNKRDREQLGEDAAERDAAGNRREARRVSNILDMNEVQASLREEQARRNAEETQQQLLQQIQAGHQGEGQLHNFPNLVNNYEGQRLNMPQDNSGISTSDAMNALMASGRMGSASGGSSLNLSQLMLAGGMDSQLLSQHLMFGQGQGQQLPLGLAGLSTASSHQAPTAASLFAGHHQQAVLHQAEMSNHTNLQQPENQQGLHDTGTQLSNNMFQALAIQQLLQQQSANQLPAMDLSAAAAAASMMMRLPMPHMLSSFMAPNLMSLLPVTRGISLALSCDGEHLSEYQILVRQQLEVFEATQDDVESNTQGRKKSVKLGQVGMRCKHCAILPLRQRGKGAVYYPTQLKGIYQAAQNMAASHLSASCQCIDPRLKETLKELRKRRDTASGGKNYWADGARSLGIVEHDGGLRIQTAAEMERTVDGTAV